MANIKALGQTQNICGWSENHLDAKSVGELLSLLPSALAEMKRKGEILILVNGSEVGSIGGDSTRLDRNDEIVLLPVVHGG
jgi:molybdopterin converting factor small subunit